MKALIILMLVMFLLCGGAWAAIPTGAEAYYWFDGDVLDGSGNGHDGTIMGSGVASYVSGKYGQGIYFDGVGGDYVDFGAVPGSAASFTLAFWMNSAQADSDQNQGVIGKTTSYGWTAVNGWNYKNYQGRAEFITAAGKNEQGGVYNQDVWIHLAYVVTNLGGGYCNIDLYKNGVSLKTWSARAYNANSTDTLRIGEYSGTRLFQGTLDEIYIYHRALIASEIVDLRDAVEGRNDAPTVNAGDDKEVVVIPTATSTRVSLTGSASDMDGPTALTTVWTVESGCDPAEATFEPSADVADPSVVLPGPGIYTLRLTAYDGADTNYDEVTIIVDSVATGTGVAACYLFENNVNDSSASGNDGVLVGNATFVELPGDLGHAIKFSGTDGAYIDCGDKPGSTKKLTIAFWLKADPNMLVVNNNGVGQVDRADFLAKNNGTYGWSTASGWDICVRSMNVDPNDTSIGNHRIVAVFGANKNTIPNTHDYFGNWTHIAFTVDGDGSSATLKSYYDGGLYNTYPDVPYVPDTVNSLLIGQINSSDPKMYQGLMDNIIIFDRILSDSEINDLCIYDDASSFLASTIAHYQLEGDAVDSGGANDGTISGAPTTVSGSSVYVDLGNALDFAPGDYIEVASPDAALDRFASQRVSVAAWVKFTEDNSGAIIAGKPSTWCLKQASNGKVSFDIGGGVSLLSLAALNDGQWHHVAGTYNNQLAALFVDGVIEASVLATDVIVEAGEQSSAFQIAYNFAGTIDDVVVFSGGLSQDAVESLTGLAANQAPIADAGADISIEEGQTASLDGSGTTDDGLPPGSPLAYLWTVDSKPEGSTVTFGDENSVQTTAAFDAGGAYVLRLTVDDGELSGDDTVEVTYLSQGFADPSLLMHLRFGSAPGGVTPDSTIYGHDGTLTGNALVVNDQLTLDGTVGTSVDCGSGTIGQWADFDAEGTVTLAAWVKLNAGTSDWQMVINKSVCYRLQVRNDQTTDNILFAMRYIDEAATASFDFSDGAWHHVVATYDGAAKRVYVDGNKIQTFACTGNWALRDAPIQIGKYFYNDDWNLNGFVDEVRLYSTALNDEQVSELYDSGL